MANEFKVRKGLVINGSGSVLLDIQGSQGQLFSVTDQLSGSLFSVSDISGIPVMEAFSDNTIKIGKYGSEAIKVSGSVASVTGSFTGSFIGVITGSLFGTASQALTASYLLGGGGSGVGFPYSGSAQITGSLGVTGSINSTGNITTTGTLTAQTLVVQTITSSIEYSSGSNIFGSRLTDTQTMTGSVNITGSLSSAGAFTVTNDVSASATTRLSFGPGTAAGSNLFLQTSGSSGTNAFEIRPYNLNNNTNSYLFVQPQNLGFSRNMTFDQNNASITILSGNSDGGNVLSRVFGGEFRLASNNPFGGLGFMTFYTSGSERVRVDGSGSLLLNTSTYNGYLTTINGADILRFPNGALYVTGSSSFTGSINVKGNITTTGSLGVTGSISASGSIGVAVFSSNADSLVISGSLNLTGSFTQVGYQILTAVSQSFNYANDAAAAAGGIPLGGLYRNGNAIQIRLV